jgi:tripartite-type tricarboxylate transporter receptor subunit TctC
MFRLQTGTSFSHVYYQKPQQRLGDLLSGRTHFSFYNTPSVVDHVATGKLRALALAGPRRVAALKDVPTVVEEGFPNLVAEDWFGFLVKTGTPDETIRRLNAAVNKVLAKQKTRDAFARLGYEPAGGTSAELGKLLASQLAYWAKVVKDAATIAAIPAIKL